MRAITSTTAMIVNERGYLNLDNSQLIYPNVQGAKVVTSTPYTIQSTDEYIGVNVAGAATILLPSTLPTTGLFFNIKDESGNAKTNNITLSGAGSTIDGQSTYVLNYNYQAVTIVYSSSNNWFII